MLLFLQNLKYCFYKILKLWGFQYFIFMYSPNFENLVHEKYTSDAPIRNFANVMVTGGEGYFAPPTNGTSQQQVFIIACGVT